MAVHFSVEELAARRAKACAAMQDQGKHVLAHRL